MGLFALHRKCGYVVESFLERLPDVPFTSPEVICGEGMTMDEARNNFNRLTGGKCLLPPLNSTATCSYWEENTFLLRIVRPFVDFAHWLGE